MKDWRLFKNIATGDEQVWEVKAVSEDSNNFYLHGYVTEKYGIISNYLTLPKFLWTEVK